jgi:hypothetical protein
MTSIRRGQTVETRNETQLRGLLKQAEVAQKAGPVAFGEWITATKNLIPELCTTIAQGGNAQASGAGGKTGG